MAVSDNLRDKDIWLRGLFMLLFAVIYSVARLVLAAVVILQFLIRLIGGNLNPRLLTFGGQLSSYLYEVMRYLTFVSETRPFPFSDWPKGAYPTDSFEQAEAAQDDAEVYEAEIVEEETHREWDDDEPTETGVR